MINCRSRLGSSTQQVTDRQTDMIRLEWWSTKWWHLDQFYHLLRLRDWTWTKHRYNTFDGQWWVEVKAANFLWGTEDTCKCTGTAMGTQGAECEHKCPIRTVTTFWTSEWGTALLPVSRATWFYFTLHNLITRLVASPRLYEVEVDPAKSSHGPLIFYPHGL